MSEYVKPPMDARCAIILLLLSNIIAFTQDNIWVELGMFFWLCVTLAICGCFKQMLKWCITFLTIIIVQSYLIPLVTCSFVSGFAVMFSYVRKMMPCLMVGTIIVKKIPTQHLILALRRFRLPQAILIPLSVTIRYIPSIKEEHRHLCDAMKLRNIHGLKRFEYSLVPLIMSAATTADELSAAAVTRGVENPCKKTSVFEMHFTAIDYISMAVCVSLTILSLMLKGEI